MRLTGNGVSPGVGYGPVRRLVRRAPIPPPDARHGGDADAEFARAEAVLERVGAELQALGRAAGGVAQDILAAQAMMARDPSLRAAVRELIDGGAAAARAIYDSFAVFHDALVRAGGRLAERAGDIDDVRDRALVLLDAGATPGPGVLSPLATGDATPYVLVARDLAPSDMAVLTPGSVAALLLEEGGPTSHTVILARAMGVPAVVGCAGAMRVPEGTVVLVDGDTGQVRVAPTPAELARTARRATYGPATHRPGRTADGRPVALLANIGSLRDLPAAVGCGAEGVGLLRTEFLYLGRRARPRVSEQREAYRAVLDAFPEGQVVVRTLDAGADKPLAFLPPAGHEPNPALGMRGVRAYTAHPEILTEQLTAIAEAAAGTTARLGVMAPMVTTVEEAERFVRACHDAGLPTAGVMIEVPAAALRARDLAEVADFFSIGTNDLVQFTFAADREVGSLHSIEDPWHPALLDLVALVAEAAARAGRQCCVCGEAAADPALACVFVGLGVTALSMAPAALGAVRRALAGHTLDRCRAAAAAARAATTAKAARTAARALLPALGDA